MKPKIAIIGDGHVGSALARGLGRTGYEVRSTGKEPDKVQEAATWADVVVIAVPFAAIDETVRELDDAANGKTVIDVTNALGPDKQLAIGFTTSGAEELQRKLAGARVVKAFNTVFAAHMDSGQVKGKRITAFIAGDDEAARATVVAMAADIGFDPIDSGALKNARWLETLGYFNIQLGYAQKMGTEIGFELVH